MARIFLILLFSALAASILAQGPGSLLIQKNEKNLIIKEWTVIEGLASNSVRKIGRTKNGFLFVVTYNGISLFDGKNFTNYTSSNAPAIKSNNIYDFCVDKDSIFWIATHRGVVVYNGKDFFIPKGLEALEEYSIQCINVDKSGVLWVGTTSNGLFRFRNNKLEKITELQGIEKNIISLIFPDKSGNVWIGTENGDLYQYDGKNYTEVYHAEINNGMLAAIEDEDGNYYFGTRNGLYTYKNDSIQLINKDINFINDIRQDKNGRLWIATNSGLFYYDKVNKQFFSAFSRKSLVNQIIQTVFFDDEDMIWIGTYRKGLLQIRIGAFKNHSFSSLGIEEIPSALEEINDSTLWIGTDEGKIFELQNNKLRKIEFYNNLSGSRIKSIFVDSKKTIWICSYKGLLKYKNGKESLLNSSTGLPDNTIRSIVEAGNGNYWVGTRQSGLYLISEDLKVLKILNTSNGLSSNFVMTLVKGPDGKLFIGTKNGIDIIANEDFIAHYHNENGLAEDMVFNLYEDDDKVIWVATINGLSRIENDSIISFRRQQGLLDDKIFDVIEDENGYLWLPTMNGIQRIEKAELNEFARGIRKSVFAVSYDKSDGLFDPQYVSASKALKKKNGEIVFNVISGISILDPHIANSTDSKQSLFIKNISTESEVIPNNKELLIVPSSSRYLQIDFSYIDFINPDKVEFKYLLEPFDVEWQISDANRFVRYTNLPPGNYIFKLKAIIKSKGGEVLTKSINFKIEPAFYETMWFRVVVIAVLILLIWLFYAIRLKTIQAQKEQLEKTVAERTAKISQQKDAIEQNIEDLEKQKSEIALKNKEILKTRNKIQEAYLNLKLLSDLGKEITSSLSEEDIATSVFQNINSLMDSDLVSIGNYNPVLEKIRFNGTIFKGEKIKIIESDLDPLTCILSFSIKDNVDIISNNFSHDYPGLKISFPKVPEKFNSLIVLPLRSKDEIIGILTAQSYSKNAYTEHHFNMLQNLAVYVSIAIENAKTYRKIQMQKDELQHVNAAKDKMFSIIGHDLRGPVGTIKSFLDLLIENPEMTNTENTLNILKTMQQSLGSAYSLLDNLLVWAQSQRGQIEFKPQNFYIKQPIDESISLVAESARNKDISIETEIGFNQLVYADQNMITTVMRNLISNAIKFTPRNGSIKVITSRFENKINGNIQEQVEIKVVDSGIGISQANIDKILKLSELFSTPGTEKEQGSGLGIGICIDFLKAHHQKLIVENNQELHKEPGSTFKFYLNTQS